MPDYTYRLYFERLLKTVLFSECTRYTVSEISLPQSYIYTDRKFANVLGLCLYKTARCYDPRRRRIRNFDKPKQNSIIKLTAKNSVKIWRKWHLQDLAPKKKYSNISKT